jgi:hypothetical protein
MDRINSKKMIEVKIKFHENKISKSNKEEDIKKEKIKSKEHSKFTL